MKRGLILFLAAVLALVGCKKEVATGVQGGDQTVTFSVVADNAATKAGEATAIPSTIDTCVAVVRMYDAHDVLIGNVYASPKCTKDGQSYKFSVDLMGGQKYEVTVLLYTQGVYDVDSKLEAIKRSDERLQYNLADEHDMFSASVTYQAGETTPLIIAKRPFAQLNLITTDLVQNFEPAVTVKYKAPSTFNAVTGVASGEQTYETTGVVTTYAYAPNQCTISSDYIFASDEKSLISVEMKAEKVGTFVRTFDNLPLQRNYKTNVIGKLLTVDAPFTVQVNSDWSTPDNDIQWQNAENIAAANAILADAPAGKDLNIKVNMPKDAAAQKITFTTKNSNTNTTFKFENNFASESTADKTITFTKDADATVMPASVTIEAPAGTNLVFEKETHVVINGTNYGVISGTFSATTLVINEGVHVGKIIINGGGLEIHGTVDALEVSETDHAKNPVLVRDCENLNETVYAIAKQYVAEGYKGDDLTKSIIPIEFLEDENGVWHIASYGGMIEFSDAVAKGQSFLNKTVVLDCDVDMNGVNFTPIGPGTAKSFQGTFDGQNHTVANLLVRKPNNYGNGFFGTLLGPATVKNVTFKNANVDYNGSSITGNIYGVVAAYAYGNVTFENVHVDTARIIGYGKVAGILGMAADPNGTTTVKNCSVKNLKLHGVYNCAVVIGLCQNIPDVTGFVAENNWHKLYDSADYYIDIDTTAVCDSNREITTNAKGLYWRYEYGQGAYYYAAWAEYYNEYGAAKGDWIFPEISDCLGADAIVVNTLPAAE